MPAPSKKNSSPRLRRKFLRSLIVKLDCGHEHEIATSFYRLTKVRMSLIFGGYIRKGLNCIACRAGSMPKSIARTERTEGCRVANENAQGVLFR